jgi:hypothetical protein
MRFKIKYLLLFFLSLTLLSQDMAAEANERRRSRKRNMVAAQRDSQSAKHHRFLDSLKNDSLFAILKAKFTIKVKNAVVPRVKDPFDPFSHQAFYRVGQAKFWFFLISIVILGLFLYYRAAFPKQFYQRYRGVFNNYYFNELIADRSLSFTSGSLVCILFSTFVMAQIGLLIAVFSKFLQLNSVVFFVVVLISVSLWKVTLYFSQRLQSFVFSSGDVSRSLLQKQITIDFWVSVVLFPILNIVYYNPYRLKHFDMSQNLLLLVVLWFVLKMLVQLLYLIREKHYSFTNILYFCALEVLPHAILTKTLFSISQTQ